MSDLLPRTCECNNGTKMCEHRPCWGTPQQIERLLDLGYDPKRFWLDRWDGSPTVFLVSPATARFNFMPPQNHRHAPEDPRGACEFLTRDGKCELHHVCKPISGAIACCEYWDSPIGIIRLETAYAKVVATWKTAHGVQVVNRWCNLVGMKPLSDDYYERIYRDWEQE